MFHESYGELDPATLTLIRKRNVSPADYDTIVGVVGTDQKVIREVIETYTVGRQFSAWRMIGAAYANNFN
jgi:hypothetical protein